MVIIPMGIPNDHQLDPASAGLLESIAQGLNIDVRHEQIHALALALVLALEPPFTIQTTKTKHAWFVHATPLQYIEHSMNIYITYIHC